MNTQKMRLAALVLAAGLPGAAQADVFTNDIVANTPFAISVDTHIVNNNQPFTYNNQPLGQPYAVDYVENYAINYQTVLLSTNTVITAPQIGVAGSADTYETYSLSYDIATTRYQTAGTNALMVGGELAGSEYTGAQTYSITGQIENLIGANLLNGGNGEISFVLGANWDSFGVNAPENLATNFTVALKLGSSLEQLDTVAVFSNSDFGNAPGAVPAAFDFNNGNILPIDIPVTSWSSSWNFSGATYFEAEFSVISGANLFPALYLGVGGGVYETSPLLVPYEETYTVLASTEVIPALPVPEPETYAMLLAGLGLVGWASRRRISAV
jgi:hypothetical protein